MTFSYRSRLMDDLDHWLRTHGGCIDEADYDAQGEFVDGFLLPLLDERAGA